MCVDLDKKAEGRREDVSMNWVEAKPKGASVSLERHLHISRRQNKHETN